MKKNLKIFMLILIAFAAFSIGITKAYAAGEHEFSLKTYNCGTFDPDEMTCLGPDGDYETPEIDVNHGTILPGQTIKMAVYYKPGDNPHTMMAAVVHYDHTMVTPLHLYDDLVLEMTGTPDNTANPGPYPGKNASASGKLQTNWIIQYNDSTSSYTIRTIIEDNSGQASQRKFIEQEGVLFYVYFIVKDDATPGDTISFTFDTSDTGTMLGNGAPITTRGADIDVYEEQSDDNTLQTLTVKNGNTTYSLTPEFVPGSKTNKTFTAYVPSNITSVDIEATKHEEHEVISGTGTKSNLQYGNNSYDISVLSQSGQTEIYTVKVYRLNSENTLSALALSNVDFGTFSSSTTSYTANVPYTTDKTNVTATATAGNKATLTGTGNNKPLNVGSNTISVKVTPENCGSAYSNVPGNTCEEKTYTVTVTREAPSTISTLNDLTVDTERVTGFTPGDPSKTYTLSDVGYDKSSIIIDYVKGEEHETVTGDGTKNLSVGQNSFDVVVTAQDGTTKTTYTIKIYRKSNNANLSALTVTSSKTGSLDPAFIANTTNYTYHTDADETSVNISYTKADTHASVVTTPVSLTGINPRNTSSVTIEVTPEDTTKAKKTYTITFDIAKSTNGDLSEITIDSEPISGFQSNKKEYDITVPSTTESVNVGATPVDNRAQVTGGTGVNTLEYGENTVEITVQPEDPTAEPVKYTLTITREKENVSTLNDLLVDTERVTGFTPGDPSKTYTLSDVGYDKSSIIIGYVKGEDHETVTGDGTKNLSVGQNSFDVVVTAHNGTDKTTYTIKVYRKSNDATLKSLNISASDGGTLDPSFSPSTENYTYSVGADEDEVSISGVANHANAEVSYTGLTNGKVNPQNVNQVTITVTPEDNTKPSKTYTITFEVAQSSNANLSNLTIDGTIITGFRPDKTNYEIEVPSTTSQVDIEAELEDGRGTIGGDTGIKSLDYDDNEFTVTGYAEDGTPKAYHITITRERKHDASLVSLKVDGNDVPGFSSTDPSGTDYYIPNSVSYSTSSVEVTCVTSDEDALVSGAGNRDLEIGDNRLKVTITAHDGATTTDYYINIRRKDNDATLKSLTITSDPAGSLNQAFDPNETNYTYTVDRDETEVEIDAEPNGELATVMGKGAYNPQEDESVTLTVTSENGETLVYTITFVKAKSTNADLDSLEVEDHTISPEFSANETSYSLTVPSSVDKVNIIAHAADRLATIEGDGEQDLDYGSNILEVVVKPEDPNAESKTYTINVTRELSDSVKLLDLTVDDATVPGFDPDEPAYNLGTVENDKDFIVIGATTSGPVTKIEGTGRKELEVGEQTFPVTITAQDGTTTGVYTITITRKGSSDATLKSLEVVDHDLDSEFDPTKTNYSVTVPSDVTSVTVNATPNEEHATVDIQGDDDLQPGENTITVTVNPQEGEPKVYTITVTREEDDEKITSQVRLIEDGMIKDVVYKSLPENLKDQCDNDNDKLFIYPNNDSETEVSESQQLGTGMVIKLIKNGRLNDSDILIVKGDVDGNSTIELLDAVIVLNHFLGRENLEGIWFEAGDTDSDTEVGLLDAVNILGIFLNN